MLPIGVSRGGTAALSGFALLAATLLLPARAGAELVTYTFAGTVSYVSDGTQDLDLTGLISLGQPVVFSYTVERNTAPSYSSDLVSNYDGATSLFDLTIGGYTCSVAAGSVMITVRNDNPSGPYDPGDTYSLLAGGVVSPPLGRYYVLTVSLKLGDPDGTVFDSTALPRELPPIDEFETRTLELSFSNPADGGEAGFVRTALLGVTTPALPTSWGRIKARYRD